MQSPGVLHYVVLPTRVGSVLVLMSSRGVVDVLFDGGIPVCGRYQQGCWYGLRHKYGLQWLWKLCLLFCRERMRS